MSLVAFRAKNHPQQPVRDDVDDRRTPLDFWLPLHAERAFTIDAAASVANALLPTYWTRDTDAIKQSWTAHRVWCNPPYSGLEAWVAKAWREMILNDCAGVTMLLPANRCEQRWWQDHIEPWRDGEPRQGVRLTARFLAGRMRFNWPATRVVPAKGDRPPFGCVLVTWTLASPTEANG